MDLIIKSVPDVESVKTEIITNALTTISNFMRRSIPISQEAMDVEVAISAIRDKNIVKPVEPMEG